MTVFEYVDSVRLTILERIGLTEQDLVKDTCISYATQEGIKIHLKFYIDLDYMENVPDESLGWINDEISVMSVSINELLDDTVEIDVWALASPDLSDIVWPS